MKISERLEELFNKSNSIIITSENIQKVKELTENNLHTEARLYLAKLFKYDDLVNKFNSIKWKQDRENNLTPELNEKRQKYTNELLKYIKADLQSNTELFNQIKRSL